MTAALGPGSAVICVDDGGTPDSGLVKGRVYFVRSLEQAAGPSSLSHKCRVCGKVHPCGYCGEYCVGIDVHGAKSGDYLWGYCFYCARLFAPWEGPEEERAHRVVEIETTVRPPVGIPVRVS
jgi:hypothetical protein